MTVGGLANASSFEANIAGIMKIPGNEFCADCNAKGPRWASVNLGILICIECSGLHRGMGTHISVVKSLTLDIWNLKWVMTVHKIGNTLAKAYYEYNLPALSERPTQNDSKVSLETWIRSKYEQKLYIPPNSHPPEYYVNRGEDPNLSIPGRVKTMIRNEALSDSGVDEIKQSCDSKNDLAAQPDLLDSLLDSSPKRTIPTKELNDLVGLEFLPSSSAGSQKYVKTQLNTEDILSNDLLLGAKHKAATTNIDELLKQENLIGFGTPTFPVIVPEIIPKLEKPNFQKPPAHCINPTINTMLDSSVNDMTTKRTASVINSNDHKPSLNTDVLEGGFKTGWESNEKSTIVNKNNNENDVFNFDFGALDKSFATIFASQNQQQNKWMSQTKKSEEAASNIESRFQINSVKPASVSGSIEKFKATDHLVRQKSQTEPSSPVKK